MLSILSLISKIYPAAIVVSQAFAYGASKYGNGTWKNDNVGTHLIKAIDDINAWRGGSKDKALLADAGLRVLFAICLAIANGTHPKEYVAK